MKPDRQVALVEGKLAGCGEWAPVHGACPACGANSRLFEAYFTLVAAPIETFMLLGRTGSLMVSATSGTGHDPDDEMMEVVDGDTVSLPEPFVFCKGCNKVVPESDLVVTFYKEPE